MANRTRYMKIKGFSAASAESLGDAITEFMRTLDDAELHDIKYSSLAAECAADSDFVQDYSALVIYKQWEDDS